MPGHIYRRTNADGSPSRWYAVIDLPTRADGRRRQKTSAHNTRRQAMEWLTRTAEENRVGDHYDTTIRVSEYLRTWLAGKQALRPSTRSEYARHIDTIYVPHLGCLRLVDLRAHHVEDVFATLTRKGVTPQTQRRILATLHSALNTAVKRGLIRRNPAATVELARAPRCTTTVWNDEQATAFLRDASSDELYLLYRILLLTGMRRGEAIGLRWCDLNMEERTVTITRSIGIVHGQQVVGAPKTDAGHRTVHLDQDTADQLRNLHRLTVLGAQPGHDPSFDPVFSPGDGRPYPPAGVSRHFTVLVRRLGLPVIRLHDLRHTSASLALAHGEPLLQVSRRLGHSGIGITADVYSHITPQAAANAANTLANTLTKERKHA